MAKKGRSVVGLDIGTSSVKLVELKETGKGIQLSKAGIMPLPPEAIVERSIMDASTVVLTIKDLLSSQKVRKKDVAISLAGHAVIIKKVNMPKMTGKELEENILVEAERYIPFEMSEVNVDFSVLSSPEEGDMMEVLLVAAKRDLIEDYSSVVREAGLNPVIVDVDVFALQNAFELNYPMEVGDMVVLCDIGASMMNLNIVKDGKSLFTRDISIGGNLYSEELQKEIGVNFEEAERMKMGHLPEGVTPQMVERVMSRVSSTVAMEIAKSIDFFVATFPEERIARLYLTGGCAKIPSLKRAIEERLNISVEIFNPFNMIESDPRIFSPDYLEEIAPFMSVGVGLAIRKV